MDELTRELELFEVIAASDAMNNARTFLEVCAEDPPARRRRSCGRRSVGTCSRCWRTSTTGSPWSTCGCGVRLRTLPRAVPFPHPPSPPDSPGPLVPLAGQAFFVLGFLCTPRGIST